MEYLDLFFWIWIFELKIGGLVKYHFFSQIGEYIYASSSSSISFLAFLATMMVQISKTIIPIKKRMVPTETAIAPAPAPSPVWANTMIAITAIMALPMQEKIAQTIQTRIARLLREWVPRIRMQWINPESIPLIIVPSDPLKQPRKLKTAREMPKTNAALTFVAQQHLKINIIATLD